MRCVLTTNTPGRLIERRTADESISSLAVTAFAFTSVLHVSTTLMKEQNALYRPTEQGVKQRALSAVTLAGICTLPILCTR